MSISRTGLSRASPFIIILPGLFILFTAVAMLPIKWIAVKKKIRCFKNTRILSIQDAEGVIHLFRHPIEFFLLSVQNLFNLYSGKIKALK